MSIINRIGQAYRVLTGREERSLTGGCSATLPVGAWERYHAPAGDYNRFAHEAYEINAVVFACVWKLMQGCKIIPLQLAIDGKPFDEGKIPAQFAPLAGLIDRPNPQTGYRAFVERWMMQLALGGNTYAEVIGAGIETIGTRKRALASPELWLIKPNQMRLDRVNANAREPKSYTDTARRITYKPEEIIHWRLPNPTDDLLGLPLLEAASTLVVSSNSGFAWNASLLQNSAVPAGILFLKELRNMTDRERDKVIKDFEQRFGGVTNAGRTYVTAAETADYKQLAQSAKDLDWKSGQRETMRYLCALLGVPSKLLNDPEAGTYANYQEARASFFLETILPWMEFFADELSHRLLRQYDTGLSFALDTRRVNELIINVDEVRHSLSLADWMTDDEKRAEDPAELQTLGGDAAKLKAPPPTLGQMLGAKDPQQVDAKGDKKRSREPGIMHGTLDLRSEPLPYVARGSLYPTLEARNDAAEDYDRRRRKWEAKWKPEIIEYFEQQLPGVLDELAKGVAVDEALRRIGALDQFIARFEPLEIGLTVDFGQAGMDELKQAGFVFNIDRPGLKGRIASDLADRSKLINGTTARQISEVLEAAVNEGVQEQARRIRELYSTMSYERSVAIAQTETGRASTSATLEGYRQGGVKYKEWVSARDDDVRTSHKKADGQVVGLDDMFALGDTRTQGPGLSGVAKEDIRCRCRIAPLFDPSEKI